MWMDHDHAENEVIESSEIAHLNPRSDEALQEMLLRELHHRFYNSLQAVTFMVGATVRNGGSIEALHALQGRIGALAQIHRLLADTDEADGSLGPICEMLSANLRRAFDREETMTEVRMDPFRGDPMIRRGILLLVVELVTNALKHGRGPEPSRIVISLADLGEGFELVVIDSGSGLPSLAAAQPRIAKSLARCLGGTLTVRATPHFEVRVALPRNRAALSCRGRHLPSRMEGNLLCT